MRAPLNVSLCSAQRLLGSSQPPSVQLWVSFNRKPMRVAQFVTKHPIKVSGASRAASQLPALPRDTLRCQQQLQMLQEGEGTSHDPAGGGGRAKAHVGVILWFTRWHLDSHPPPPALAWRLVAKPRYQRGADPTALTPLLGTLPLPMARGALAWPGASNSCRLRKPRAQPGLAKSP